MRAQIPPQVLIPLVLSTALYLLPLPQPVMPYAQDVSRIALFSTVIVPGLIAKDWGGRTLTLWRRAAYVSIGTFALALSLMIIHDESTGGI